MSYIQTRSPFYVAYTATAPSSITSVTFKVYVDLNATADKFSPLAATVTKNNPDTTTDQNMVLDLSPFIRPSYRYLPFVYSTTQLSNSHYAGALSVFVAATDQDGVALAGFNVNFDAVDGYTYYSEGANNTEPDNGLFLSNNYYVVDRNYNFSIGFINDGTVFDEVEVDGVSYFPVAGTFPNSIVKHMWIDLGSYDAGEVIDVNFKLSSTTIETVQLEIREECKYDPVQIHFLNKYGQFEIMTFFKAKKESIKIESETAMVNIRGNSTSYSTQLGQMQRFNTQGQESMTLNTGFLPESSNQTIEELLLSEYVYMFNGVNFDPVRVVDTTKEFQTRINDKLISHTVRFEKNHKLINNA